MYKYKNNCCQRLLNGVFYHNIQYPRVLFSSVCELCGEIVMEREILGSGSSAVLRGCSHMMSAVTDTVSAVLSLK